MMERYAIDAAVISHRAARRVLRRPGRGERDSRAWPTRRSPARARRDPRPLRRPRAAAAARRRRRAEPSSAHALDTLGLDGVLLLSHVAGTYLGDPAWEPLYAELDRRGAVRLPAPHRARQRRAARPPGLAVRVPVRHHPRAGEPHLQRHVRALPEHPLAGGAPRRRRAVPRPSDRLAGRPRAGQGRSRRRPAR